MMRLALVLLSWVCSWTRTQHLDYDRWDDHAEMTRGLCRYGNSVECCWGWTETKRGRCKPECQQGCKHGDCVGPDRCKCHPGYTGKACNHDLNECGVKPRPCKHRCMNTPGSYKCYCADGFSPQPDGSCKNARTCFHANCQYGCEVMKGAVRCTCPSPGLRLGPDRRTCIDIDECALGGGVCPRRRKCMNTFGSFFCKCHLGFQLVYINGRYSCIDKDPRPFCSLNPSSPKCRCKDGSCKAVPKVIVEPHRPRTTTPIITITTATTTATTITTTTAATTTTLPTTTPITTAVLDITTDATTKLNSPTPIADTGATAAVTTTIFTTSTTTITDPTTTETDTTPPTTATAQGTTAVATTTKSPTTSTTIPAMTQLGTTPPTLPTATTTAVTTTLPTTSVVTTTLNNRINKDVTQKQRGDVHIPRHPGHNHVWEFDIELGNVAEDAKDDPDAGVLQCTFDQGLCDWMSDRDGDLHWEIISDPTGGRYLSVPELQAGQRSIRGARLAVQIVPSWSCDDLCFSFSHWLTGHHMGVLQLFVRKRGRNQRYGSAHWSRTGGHGWRSTQVTVATQAVDRVLLKAERRIGQRGRIAIDDVTVRRGACR